MKAGRDESEQQPKWSKEKKIRVMDCPNSCDRRHFGNRGIALNQGGAKQEPSTEQSEESKTASEVTQTPEDGEEQEDPDRVRCRT